MMSLIASGTLTFLKALGGSALSRALSVRTPANPLQCTLTLHDSRPDHHDDDYELPLCALTCTGNSHTNARQGTRKAGNKEGARQGGKVEAREKEVVR